MFLAQSLIAGRRLPHLVPVSCCCLNEQKQVDEVVSEDPDDPCEVVAYVPPLQPVRDEVIQTVTIGRLGWLQPVGCTERVGKIT